MLKKLSLALKRRLLPILKGLIPDGWRLVPTEGFELVPTDQFDLVPKGKYDYVPKGTYVFGPMDRFVLMPKNRYRVVLLPGQTVSGELGVGWVTEDNSPAGYDLLWGDGENLAAFRAEANHVRDKLTVEIANAVEKNLHPQAAVVDIGCGVGDLLVEMRRRQADITVAGLDFSPKAVEGAQTTLPDGSFMQFVIEKHLPYETNAFDVVLCTDVLEHLENPQSIVAELVRICRPGGSVFIVVPDGDVDTFLGHYWFWNQATLQEFLAEWKATVTRLPITREFIAHILI